MAVERFLEFFAAAIDERPDAGRVWSGGGAVPGVVRGSSRSASSSRNRASRSLPGGIERTQAQVLADAVLMVGDRLLPTGVGVDRLGVGSQLQGGEPQDLPVNLPRAPLGKSAEHTHEGDLIGEPQLIVAAPPQGDLASVGLEKAGIAHQAGA